MNDKCEFRSGEIKPGLVFYTDTGKWVIKKMIRPRTFDCDGVELIFKAERFDGVKSTFDKYDMEAIYKKQSNSFSNFLRRLA